MKPFRTPSAEELYALERIARRERSRVVGQMFSGAAQRVRNAFVAALTRPYAASRVKEVRHA